MINTEQTVAIIEAIGNAIPEAKMKAEPNMNFLPLLALGIIPVVLAFVLNRYLRRKK